MKGLFLSRVLSLGAPAMFQSWIVCIMIFFAQEIDLYIFSYQILPEFSKKKGKLHLLLCHFHAVSKDVTIALDCVKERGSVDVTSSGCGLSYPLFEVFSMLF